MPGVPLVVDRRLKPRKAWDLEREMFTAAEDLVR